MVYGPQEASSCSTSQTVCDILLSSQERTDSLSCARYCKFISCHGTFFHIVLLMSSDPASSKKCTKFIEVSAEGRCIKLHCM
jgi:hypothetical protein